MQPVMLLTVDFGETKILLNNGTSDIKHDGKEYIACPFNFCIKPKEIPRANETALQAMIRLRRHERPVVISFPEDISKMIAQYSPSMPDIRTVQMEVVATDGKDIYRVHVYDDFYDPLLKVDVGFHHVEASIELRSQSYDMMEQKQ